MSKYIFSATPLRAINLLKARMNSLVIWLASNSKWIALLRLYVLQNQEDLWIKMLWLLKVLFFVNFPVDSVSYDFMWWRFLMILFVNCLNFGIQYWFSLPLRWLPMNNFLVKMLYYVLCYVASFRKRLH